MRKYHSKIGGHLSAASRLEAKARVLEAEGQKDEAALLRLEAAEHRARAKHLKDQLYG